MKSIITNYGKSLAIETFQNIITKYALIGTTTKDDQTLIDILNKDSTILENLNIINKNPANILTKYIISDAGIIDSKMIDNKLRLLFQINLDETKMPLKKFVYAIALANENGEVYSVSSFAESFNSLKDATETVKIIHNIVNPENMEENLTYVKDGDFFVTRDEMSSFINNHTHKELINRIELDDAVTNLDNKKADKITIGDLNSVNSSDKTTVVAIFNEIIRNIGDLNQLSTTEKTSLVSSINELKTKIGDVPNSSHNTGADQFVYTDIKDGLDKLFQKIKDIPEPHFKDGFNTKDVNWNDKADVRLIGDLDSFHGTARENIMAMMNEIFDVVGSSGKFIEYPTNTFTTRGTNPYPGIQLYDGTRNYKGDLKIVALKNDVPMMSFNVEIDSSKSIYLIKDTFYHNNLLDIQDIFLGPKINNDRYSVLQKISTFGLALGVTNNSLILLVDFMSLSYSSNNILNGQFLYDKIKVYYGKMDLEISQSVTDGKYELYDPIDILEGYGIYNRHIAKRVKLTNIPNKAKVSFLNNSINKANVIIYKSGHSSSTGDGFLVSFDVRHQHDLIGLESLDPQPPLPPGEHLGYFRERYYYDKNVKIFNTHYLLNFAGYYNINFANIKEYNLLLDIRDLYYYTPGYIISDNGPLIPGNFFHFNNVSFTDNIDIDIIYDLSYNVNKIEPFPIIIADSIHKMNTYPVLEQDIINNIINNAYVYNTILDVTFPVGHIIPIYNDQARLEMRIKKYLLMDGSEITEQEYPELFAILPNNVDGRKYLPNMLEDGVFLSGGSHMIPFAENASIPNIKGSINNISETYAGYGGASGAFKKIGGGGDGTPAHTDWSAAGGVEFDASTFNPIYQDNAILAPKRYACRWYIKYKR